MKSEFSMNVLTIGCEENKIEHAEFYTLHCISMWNNFFMNQAQLLL